MTAAKITPLVSLSMMYWYQVTKHLAIEMATNRRDDSLSSYILLEKFHPLPVAYISDLMLATIVLLDFVR